MKETFAEMHIPYKNLHASSFLTRRMVGGRRPLFLKFWSKLTLFLQKRRFSIDIGRVSK